MNSLNIIKSGDSLQQYAVTYNKSMIINKIKQQSLEVHLYHYKKTVVFQLKAPMVEKHQKLTLGHNIMKG